MRVLCFIFVGPVTACGGTVNLVITALNYLLESIIVVNYDGVDLNVYILESPGSALKPILLFPAAKETPLMNKAARKS